MLAVDFASIGTMIWIVAHESIKVLRIVNWLFKSRQTPRTTKHPARIAIATCCGATVGLFGLMTLDAKAASCDNPPPPAINLDIPRFYADKKGSVISAEQKALHDDAVEPLVDFLREVISNADKGVRGNANAAACGLIWINTWAKAGAYLGKMEQPQADYQRKWDLAGVALAYLKLRPYAFPEQRQVIEPWLIAFADAARTFFDDPGHKRNNHWYWLGLALAATAQGTGSEKHWVMARDIFADAARDIQPDGTLPMEMERGARALHYHVFATMPLVLMAELARARGEDWYAAGNGALHRLVGVTLEGLQRPEKFDELAKITQERPVNVGAGWLQLYSLRFPERVTGRLPNVAPKHRYIGGDVLLLAQAVTLVPPAAPVAPPRADTVPAPSPAVPTPAPALKSATPPKPSKGP